MGFSDVATFRTSGNVVFQGDAPSKLVERIEAGLAEAVGFDVPTYLRTADEIEAIAGDEPFKPQLMSASRGKLQVLLLRHKPPASARRKALGLATDQDRLAFGERELYWLPSGGTRDSALKPGAVEELLGPMTMRTKGTIDALAAKYFGR
jgi:uncharacterized protein (DUF1697 family)